MRFPLELRYADFDTKGHVNNAVYLTYFEIARSRAWQMLGGDADFPFVVAEARVRYKAQARIGDSLEIEIWTSEIRTKAWVWSYRITNPVGDVLVAEGETVQVAFDYERRETMPIPPALRADLERVREG